MSQGIPESTVHYIYIPYPNPPIMDIPSLGVPDNGGSWEGKG